MKKIADVQVLMRKQVGKDAAAILKKIDEMLKRGVPRAKIEKALAAALSTCVKKCNRHVIVLIDC